ncbi:hypothetical protein MTO96_037551 [Rhipicephalus appendiculatus]
MICPYLFGTLFWTLFCANKCRTNEGEVLNNGQVRDMSRPCVRYSCHKGNLTTEKCPGAGDPLCKASFVEEARQHNAGRSGTQWCDLRSVAGLGIYIEPKKRKYDLRVP